MKVFVVAFEVPEGPKREAYLAHACGDNHALRERVVELLSVNAQAGDFLEKPLA